MYLFNFIGLVFLAPVVKFMCRKPILKCMDKDSRGKGQR